MSDAAPQVTIPASLRPADGRFGCGPSKIRPEQLAALAGPAATGWALVLGAPHAASPPARTAAATMPQILDVLLN